LLQKIALKHLLFWEPFAKLKSQFKMPLSSATNQVYMFQIIILWKLWFNDLCRDCINSRTGFQQYPTIHAMYHALQTHQIPDTSGLLLCTSHGKCVLCYAQVHLDTGMHACMHACTHAHTQVMQLYTHTSS